MAVDAGQEVNKPNNSLKYYRCCFTEKAEHSFKMNNLTCLMQAKTQEQLITEIRKTSYFDHIMTRKMEHCVTIGHTYEKEIMGTINGHC